MISKKRLKKLKERKEGRKKGKRTNFDRNRLRDEILKYLKIPNHHIILPETTSML